MLENDSRYKNPDPKRRKYKNSHIVARPVRRETIDYEKLAEALVELAILEVEKDRKNAGRISSDQNSKLDEQ